MDFPFDGWLRTEERLVQLWHVLPAVANARLLETVHDRAVFGIGRDTNLVLYLDVLGPVVRGYFALHCVRDEGARVLPPMRICLDQDCGELLVKENEVSFGQLLVRHQILHLLLDDLVALPRIARLGFVLALEFTDQ